MSQLKIKPEKWIETICLTEMGNAAKAKAEGNTTDAKGIRDALKKLERMMLVASKKNLTMILRIIIKLMFRAAQSEPIAAAGR